MLKAVPEVLVSCDWSILDLCCFFAQELSQIGVKSSSDNEMGTLCILTTKHTICFFLRWLIITFDSKTRAENRSLGLMIVHKPKYLDAYVMLWKKLRLNRSVQERAGV